MVGKLEKGGGSGGGEGEGEGSPGEGVTIGESVRGELQGITEGAG